jgi:hypothetical protein
MGGTRRYQKEAFADENWVNRRIRVADHRSWGFFPYFDHSVACGELLCSFPVFEESSQCTAFFRAAECPSVHEVSNEKFALALGYSEKYGDHY